MVIMVVDRFLVVVVSLPIGIFSFKFRTPFGAANSGIVVNAPFGAQLYCRLIVKEKIAMTIELSKAKKQLHIKSLLT